ncbi:PEP-CTERM-box response regulator transcription factor [Massilia solisilvae]|uniref:PEP-CTERM-box response regulator transcription factor n=1 Tax=Massilia solisilvae TaxID=1811225 RepID=A0ABT2BHQ8_9BURK|nr:PEP-CTERM-box response regulator transcription factor [Massilia solisilvae]MCS0608049.1 PEP-CTERM-box response regulator transcription factor [Massilia solisilvae]
MAKRKLLVVEGDAELRRALRLHFEHLEVVVADSRETALAQVRRHEPPAVLLDLCLPPEPEVTVEGLAALRQILSEAPDTKVVVLAPGRDHASALEAIGSGAYDVHHKPCDLALLSLVVERAAVLYALQQEHRRTQQLAPDSPLAGIVSRDAAMLKLCRDVERVAPTAATVMLLGESGSGKELVARALHRMSGRADARFVAINCAAIPGDLLESELFGHEKGAFTGAGQQTLGKIEMASGGTFFLDEVGDMALALQAKLLRFVQERVIERVGGRAEIAVDVRIVCATHQDLKALVARGAFREDLYYRLSEIVLAIPALRERVGDCALLAHHFRNLWSARTGRVPMRFTDEAVAAIEAYRWPGNVRELENCIKRAVIMADGPLIGASDLGLPLPGQPGPDVNLRRARAAAEYQAMVCALARADGNIARAAELMGVSRPTVYDLMHYHGIRG